MEKSDFEDLLKLSKDLDVLIVDDDLELLMHYKSIAERFFNKVTTAADGGVALQLHEIGKFDIIYTDINMPTMNGVELIRQIKKFDPKQQFIVISASDDSSKLLELIQLNINAFVLKPFNVESFIQATKDKVSVIIQSRLMLDRAKALEDKLKKVTKEKIEQETMLIQQSKLAQTGEMISMIAHQWRQPLSAISSVIATLKTRFDLDYYGDGPESKDRIIKDIYASFSEIEHSASFLSSTINDFRNYYRPDNAPKKFDLLQAIDMVVAMAIPSNSNITVKKHYLQQTDMTVVTFQGELQQVIMNIINNSIDVFGEKKMLNSRISIKVEKKSDHFVITLMDNGGGIPEDIIKHIFLPYFSTKDKKNGTGIGLHMAKTIIESHMNGSIDVDNDLIMGGARFKIVIPTTIREVA